MEKEKVLLFGGTFDPITNGHIGVARWALSCMQQYGYKSLWFLPCVTNKVEKKQPVDPEHRIKMIELALEELGSKEMFICTYEIDSNNGAGTYSVVKNLQRLFPEKEFSFVIGTDEANKIRLWRNSRKLRRLIPFVVIRRPGASMVFNSWYSNSPHKKFHTSGTPISSTMAREAIAQGFRSKLVSLVSRSVRAYIEHHGLYRGS